MVSLTLKNIPDDLIGVLRKAAVQDHRSLNQEILHILSVSLQSRLQQTEVSRYIEAYRQNPESPDELLGLLETSNDVLSELAWDDQ
ncbi:MAG: hypothetical protein WCK42_07090 [Myxococcaceae bacterium]